MHAHEFAKHTRRIRIKSKSRSIAVFATPDMMKVRKDFCQFTYRFSLSVLGFPSSRRDAFLAKLNNKCHDVLSELGVQRAVIVHRPPRNCGVASTVENMKYRSLSCEIWGNVAYLDKTGPEQEGFRDLAHCIMRIVRVALGERIASFSEPGLYIRTKVINIHKFLGPRW